MTIRQCYRCRWESGGDYLARPYEAVDAWAGYVGPERACPESCLVTPCPYHLRVVKLYCAFMGSSEWPIELCLVK